MTKLTEEDYNKLKEDLKKLEEIERPNIAKRLKEAIAEGDLSENAAYEDAKEAQGRMEAKVIEIKQILATAEVVKVSHGDKVSIGATIKVQTPQGKERNFTITGSAVANPLEGKISYDSPLGAAFLGHKKGEVVNVVTPAGEKKYKILEIL